MIVSFCPQFVQLLTTVLLISWKSALHFTIPLASNSDGLRCIFNSLATLRESSSPTTTIFFFCFGSTFLLTDVHVFVVLAADIPEE
ncbi:unnamed protein product [Callosobruchus maculatus]|uniref:Secreted protein n=1 Tax=Callosobruchus maculatus TaxID=64391 RepID=A0A653CN85_CALMS|nr:unnamed protein product [Callosobruchus maculatus]